MTVFMARESITRAAPSLLSEVLMKTWMVLTALAVGLTATPALAQDRDRDAKPATEATTPDPNASPATGGDTKPSAVDPAQSTTTGANAGEGASYNRSSEKGDSAAPKDDAAKTR